MAEIDPIFCTVCTNQIEPKRARRQTATCSEKCKDKLDAIRARQRDDRRCPHCLHPSTPGERAHYRKWRVACGDVQTVDQVKRTGELPFKRDLMKALKGSLRLLEEDRARIIESGCPKDGNGNPVPSEMLPEFKRDYDRLISQINESEKLLTPKPDPGVDSERADSRPGEGESNG